MAKLRTSSMGYWRGIPNSAHYFGYLVQGNYQIVQPIPTSYVFINSVNNFIGQRCAESIFLDS